MINVVDVNIISYIYFYFEVAKNSFAISLKNLRLQVGRFSHYPSLSFNGVYMSLKLV